MRTLRRILVAIKDPKSRYLPAVMKAAQLARASGAQIELFHGITTPVYANAFPYGQRSVTEVERETREHCLAALERVADQVRAHGLKVTVSSDWDFPAYEAIVRRANRIKADLIVAERHAGPRLAPWLLHLTDWELMRLSAAPVLLVKSARPYRRPVVLAAIDPGHAFSKPAKLDRKILQAGSLVSEALRGTLHVMHAYVPVPLIPMTPAVMSADLTARMDAEALGKARTAFARALRAVKIPAERRHLIGRYPIDAIQDLARETRSAIVVMGAVSRSGLKRVFIGNTAERVLDQLACDVLVVKPPRFVSRVARTPRGVRLVAGGLPMPY
ncbi:MAG TPA: universal stress protein [Steroidobacteraceae bacterium]|nr:universal stress protein [Steroidobacteraceae bacterium]